MTTKAGTAGLDEKALEAATVALLTSEGWTFGPADLQPMSIHSRSAARIITAYLAALPQAEPVGLYDDTDPVMAGLARLSRDGYASDAQRHIAHVAHDEILRLRALAHPSPVVGSETMPGWSEAVEACAKLCDEEADMRFDQGRKAEAGDLSWGFDAQASATAQFNKAITARGLAAAIRALSRQRNDRNG